MDTSTETEIITTKYCIIGGGIAGVSCAEQLTTEEAGCKIILVSASSLVKTVRNVIKMSERLEDFDVAEEDFECLEKKFPNCRVIRAAGLKIDAEAHEVLLSNNQKVKYQAVCICTGAVPKVISTDNPFVLGIRDTETVQVFQKRLENASRVLVVGNGGIATELVYEIENCQVVWAIKDKSVGATFFDAGAAHFFLPCLKESKKEDTSPCKRMKYNIEDKSKEKYAVGSALGPDWAVEVNMKGKQKEVRNVHVEYECEVKNIYRREEFLEKCMKETIFQSESETWPVYVELTNGTILGCDFIISATGVHPNTKLELCEGLCLDEDGGIIVNDQMQTSVEGIFAAGDVCTVKWPLSDQWFQMRLWTQARQLGGFAGICMHSYVNDDFALMPACFDLFTHVTRFFGYKVVLLGLFNGQKLGSDCELIVRASERSEYVKVILKDGRMQGAILIGETNLEETFENLILNQLDLSSYGEEILNPNIDIEDYFD